MSTAVFGKDSVTGSNDAVAISSNNLHVAQYVWDTATLSWIRQTPSSGGGGGSGGDVNVISTVGLTDTQLRASPLQTTSAEYTTRVEDTAGVMYVGKAAIGSTEGSASWQIRKIETIGGVLSIKWAGGSNTFTNAWSSRASYSYS